MRDFDERVENERADEEFVDEFDPSSDEEIEETADESVLMLQREIASSANFLL